MFKWVALLVVSPWFFVSCGGGGYGRVAFAEAPKIVNVSSYDPKEKQRGGESFSCNDVSALRRNGSEGLIARCGKGLVLDDKCSAFVAATGCSGMRLGTYYFVLKSADPIAQADQYISRLRQIAMGRKVLLVGDFDTKSSAEDLVKFINRVEQLTGVLPMIYLENSARLRSTLSNATSAQKRCIRRCPYWLALYSHSSGFETPQDLMQAYGVWDQWAMWQYAGVEWSGRSVAKHYHHGPWKSPQYFSNMDRPLEHNAFNGSLDELEDFWQKHSWQVN
jgi:Glycosyl hydrolases family 25